MKIQASDFHFQEAKWNNRNKKLTGRMTDVPCGKYPGNDT